MVRIVLVSYALTPSVCLELIVSFHEPLSFKERIRTVSENLIEIQSNKWNIDMRVADSIMDVSDYLLIKFFNKSYAEAATEKLKSDATRIRCVNYQVRYSKNLNTVNFETTNGIEETSRINLVEKLQADVLWALNVTGAGIKVAVLDTGCDKNCAECIDWTGENECTTDSTGHGTFMVSIIQELAPSAELLGFKLFTSSKVSYTAWFLDAFNYAIYKGIHVLNLSLGGLDHTDFPFVNKIAEVVASGIILVSAVGNDGPGYGTTNSPADMLEVIGVGSIENGGKKIAKFSSRGMTVSEIANYGAGRMKPDFVTYSEHTTSRTLKKQHLMFGTSVSSSVVSGVVALLLSSVDEGTRKNKISNVAAIKQILAAGVEKLPNCPALEQGLGSINLTKSHQFLNYSSFAPKVSFFPDKLDFTDCPYMWPHCLQPMYHGAITVLLNVSILNSNNLKDKILKNPCWKPLGNEKCLSLSFILPKSTDLLCVSWLGIYVSVPAEAAKFSGFCQGHIVAEIMSPISNYNISLPLKLRVVPTPPKNKRLLWDSFHNLQYPRGYFPSDDVSVLHGISKQHGDLFDWRGDYPYTNFNFLFENLVNWGYYLEILNKPATCFDSLSYGALIIIDPEAEFSNAEIEKLQLDVEQRNFSLLVFGDWYNERVKKRFEIYDSSIKQTWKPVLGGCNVPAINDLLRRYGIQLGDGVYYGKVSVGNEANQNFRFVYGTSITQFPASGWLLKVNLTNFLDRKSTAHNPVAILGLYDAGGKIAVFGDSSCLETTLESNAYANCSTIVKSMIDFCLKGVLPNFVQTNGNSADGETCVEDLNAPKRSSGDNLFLYSKQTTDDCASYELAQSKFAASNGSKRRQIFIEETCKSFSPSRSKLDSIYIAATTILSIILLQTTKAYCLTRFAN